MGCTPITRFRKSITKETDMSGASRHNSNLINPWPSLKYKIIVQRISSPMAYDANGPPPGARHR